jgi:protein-disulfide isomerase-like protein with CxxC motif
MYESDLYTTQQFGVAGFPLAIVQLDGEYYQLARGFRSHEELEVILEKAVDYHKSRMNA